MKLQNLKEGLTKLSGVAGRATEALFGGMMAGQTPEAIQNIVSYPKSTVVDGKEVPHPYTRVARPVVTTTDPRTGKTHEVKDSHLHAWVPSDRADVALASAKDVADVGIGVGGAGMVASAATPSSWTVSGYGAKIKPEIEMKTAMDLNDYLRNKFGKNFPSNPAVMAKYPAALEAETAKRVEAAQARYSKTPKAKFVKGAEVLAGPLLNTAFTLSDALSAAQNIRAGKTPEAASDIISAAGTAAYFTPFGPAVTPATFARSLSTGVARSLFPRVETQTPEQIKTGQAPSRRPPTTGEAVMGAVEAGTSVGLKSGSKAGAKLLAAQTPVGKAAALATTTIPAVAQAVADQATAYSLARQGLYGRAGWQAGLGVGKAVSGLVNLVPFAGPLVSTAMDVAIEDLEREEVGTRDEQFQELVSNKKSELDAALKTKDPEKIKAAKNALNALHSELMAKKAMELKAQEDEEEKQKQAGSATIRQREAAAGGPRLGGGLRESYLSDLLLKTKIKNHLLQEAQKTFNKKNPVTKGQFKVALGITETCDTDNEVVNESWISEVSQYLFEGRGGRRGKGVEGREKARARETSSKTQDITLKDIETTLKDAEAAPIEINVPETHPIVKKTTSEVEAEYTPPAAPKHGDILVTDTKTETSPVIGSESKTTASESLPANRSQRTSDIIVAGKSETKDITQREEKPIEQRKPEEKREEGRRGPPEERVRDRTGRERSKGGPSIIPLGFRGSDKQYHITGTEDVLALAPGEREGVVARKASWDPFRRRFTTNPVRIAESAKRELTPSEKYQEAQKWSEASTKAHGEFVNSIMGRKGGIFQPKTSEEEFSLPGSETPEQQTTGTELAAGPEPEREGVKRNTAVYDPASKRWTTQVETIAEGKLTPKESLQRKLKKQKYKISYLQDGKKVEVFASSIRGVRRVIFGKKQYRVHNTSGSDVTGYFKKLLNK